MRLLVTGASGLLGLPLASQAAEKHAVVGIVHTHALAGIPFEVQAADLTARPEVDHLLETLAPDAVIHTAALAFPDKCEDDPALAETLNAELPAWVAAYTARARIPLLHVSTEAIFDGLRGDYREDDLPNPRNHYAWTKLRGERAVAAIDPRALIVRTVFYGWSISGRRSLAEWFVTNLSAGTPVRGFTDAFFSPVLASELAAILLQMLEAGLSGVYHVGSRTPISKYEFGREIARQFGYPESLISPASVADSGLRAQRSANLALCCDKLVSRLNVPLPEPLTGLRRFYEQYRAGEAERIRKIVIR